MTLYAMQCKRHSGVLLDRVYYLLSILASKLDFYLSCIIGEIDHILKDI